MEVPPITESQMLRYIILFFHFFYLGVRPTCEHNGVERADPASLDDRRVGVVLVGLYF